MDSSGNKRKWDVGRMGFDPDPQKKQKIEEHEGFGIMSRGGERLDREELNKTDFIVDLFSEQKEGFDRMKQQRQSESFGLMDELGLMNENGRGRQVARNDEDLFGSLIQEKQRFSVLEKHEHEERTGQALTTAKAQKSNNLVPFPGEEKEPANFTQQKSKSKRKGKNLNQEVQKKQKIPDPPSYNKNNLIITKGVDLVPVDNHFSKRQNAKVLEQNKAFYSVILSQSNLATDDNKFFIIQLLEVGDPSNLEYYLFSRWGRVGVNGQIYQNGPLSKKQAIRQYNSKTQAKLKAGGYKVVERCYENQQELKAEEDQYIDQYIAKENSKLHEKVQELMKLIFDMKMMQANMRENGYDEKRSPLGLLARTAIEKGYIALDNIMKVLKSETPEQQKRNLLNQFSSDFYSAIPHDFGYLNMRAFVLNSEEKVKTKLQMLASLSQIQIYSNLMNQKTVDDKLHPIDNKYAKLKCEIAPLPKDTQAYAVIRRYLTNTHAKTHDKYVMELAEIFTLKRPQEDQKFIDSIGNKMLLWHGSRLTNYVGILSQGLKIAPFEAPSTGYMFGKGIYFADIASKSANYCLPKHNSTGLLLLCQVSLGEMNDKFTADYTAQNLPPGKHSTRGVGKFAPKSGETLEGVYVPNGQLQPTGIEQTSLLYNEYVVYNRDQIQCKYIVRVNFTLKK